MPMNIEELLIFFNHLGLNIPTKELCDIAAAVSALDKMKVANRQKLKVQVNSTDVSSINSLKKSTIHES